MIPRVLISETNSSLQEQHNDGIKEILVGTFSTIMKEHFGIVSEMVPAKPTAIRYTGAPYDHSNEDCKSLQVFPHSKGTILCPLVVFSILQKFEIPESEYLEAIAGQGKLLKMHPKSARGPNES